MVEEQGTAVDPMEKQKETTAVESDDDTIVIQSKVCPVLTLFRSAEDMEVRGCIYSDCAWFLPPKRREHEGGCSILILAQAVSGLKQMARTRNWGR